MRYNDWDVILFPRDSHVPMQEFKTACYSSSDQIIDGHESPTLTCYIGSLPPSTPFRISAHSWATPAVPSALIESRRSANQHIMYKLQVIVDGTRVFHGLFDAASKWPQEIAQEARVLKTSEQSISHRKSWLLFPPFDQDTLIQSEWECRYPGGRINVILSEQLVARTTNPTAADLGPYNEIVCFSFQHAPKDALERAGISWPIRNPLYMPTLSQSVRMASRLSDATIETTCANEMAREDHQKQSSSTLAARRPRIVETLQRPSTDPCLSRVPHPTMQTMNNARLKRWDDALGPFGDSQDGISVESWSLHRSMSPSRNNLLMDARIDPFSLLTRTPTLWATSSHEQPSITNLEWRDTVSKIEMDKPGLVTHHDDRFGQNLEPTSPSATQHNLHHNSERQLKGPRGRAWKGKSYTTQTAGSGLIASRASTTSLTRKPSYTSTSGSRRPMALRDSPGPPKVAKFHENISPSSFSMSIPINKENFQPSQTQVPHWDSDMSVRDRSSVFSSFNRQNPNIFAHLGASGKHNAQTPLSNGSINSRKEGINQHATNPSEHETRHNQPSSLPTSFKRSTTQKTDVNEHAKYSATSMTAKATDVEIIDLDAIDELREQKPPSKTTKLSPAKSLHKSGMSSMDSTGHLEQKLYSALGEELASFDSHDHVDMSPGLAEAIRVAASDPSGNATSVTLTREPEQIGKRKRHTALGGDDQDQTQTSKREKGGQVDVEERG